MATKRKTATRKTAKKPAGRRSSTRKSPSSKRRKRTTKKRPAASAKQPQEKTPADRDEGDRGSSLLEDPAHTRRDADLVRQAIAKRWPTDENVKRALLAKVARHGLASESPRNTVACLRAYMQAEAQNQNDQLKNLADKLVVTTETTVTPELQRQILLQAVEHERRRQKERSA